MPDITTIDTLGIKIGSVDHYAIKDADIRLAEIENGTSANDGKFLKNNDGAAPSWATVDTSIADASITLAKLEHGDGTSDGKFLRSNNGADPTWVAIPAAGAALTGSTDNTICTVTGANAIQGEANLTFNGSQLDLDTGSGTFNRWKTDQLRFNCTGDAHIDHYTVGQKFLFRTSASSGADTNCLEIFSTGDVEVSSGNLVIGTAGKGIDFSATNPGNSQTSHAELLDDYEEGVFTVTCDNSVTLSQNEMRYTKIGNLVNVSGMITVNSDNSQSTFRPNNFPFNNVGSGFKDLSTFSMQTENWDLHADHKGFGGYIENAKLYIRETKDNASPGGIAADSGASMLINVTYRTND